MLNRLIRFRNEVVILWHAMWNPTTPTYLKIVTALTALYLVSPADLLPDVIPVLGLVDDVLLVTFMVSWIVSRLPQFTPKSSTHYSANINGSQDQGPIISGTARHR